MTSSKPYDLVLYVSEPNRTQYSADRMQGATGFTGRLCAVELKERANVKWAIAGRSQKKLEELKRELGLAKDVDVLVADSFDVSALLEMVKSTRCVITLVGPYDSYGHLLYKTCAGESSASSSGPRSCLRQKMAFTTLTSPER